MPIFGFRKREEGRLAIRLIIGDASLSALFETPGFKATEGSETGIGIVGYLDGVPVFVDPLLPAGRVLVSYKKVEETDDDFCGPPHPQCEGKERA